MDQRLIAQSGTFVVPSTLVMPVDHIVGGYPYCADAIVEFVLDTKKIRRQVMHQLYSMNISHYALFPGLDGLARSMGYEAEYNWEFDPGSMKRNVGY